MAQLRDLETLVTAIGTAVSKEGVKHLKQLSKRLLEIVNGEDAPVVDPKKARRQLVSQLSRLGAQLRKKS